MEFSLDKIKDFQGFSTICHPYDNRKCEKSSIIFSQTVPREPQLAQLRLNWRRDGRPNSAQV